MTYRTNTADTFNAGWAQGEADALLFIATHRSDAVRNEHARQVETSQRHGLRRPMDTEYDEGRRTAYLVTLANHLERHRRAVERALITTRARRLAEGARSGDRAEKRKVTGD